MLAAGLLSAQLLFRNFCNMIIKITFCLHMGSLGLCTAPDSEVWSELLKSRICAPGSAGRRGFLLADALQVDAAISSALLQMQPHVPSTPCPPFLGCSCGNMSPVNEFSFTPFCPPFLHVRVK